ncbi:unnamed protein product [Haemonchus placei]|uniref:Secreted protein n=1 Tax=Haemonchus placei TaxID=6290 RepID=A0A0N4W4Q2_HAEPC|nr:unnamed protein product [Haemonchus placei]
MMTGSFPAVSCLALFSAHLCVVRCACGVGKFHCFIEILIIIGVLWYECDDCFLHSCPFLLLFSVETYSTLSVFENTLKIGVVVLGDIGYIFS